MGKKEASILADIQQRYKRNYTSVDRQTFFSLWLSGSSPKTEDENARMPRFFGNNAHHYQSEWLASDRKARLADLLSGEGLTTQEELALESYFIGPNADFLKHQARTDGRVHALMNWLDGN